MDDPGLASSCFEFIDDFVLPPLRPEHIAFLDLLLVVHCPPPSLLHNRAHQHPVIPSVYVELKIPSSALDDHSV